MLTGNAINGEKGLLEGCRILAGLSPHRDEEAWATIVHFDDESELCPTFERRPLYASQYLTKLDQERVEWENRSRSAILEACEWLVREYGTAEI